MSQKPESLFDKRIVDRNIKREKLTRKEHKQYLKGLPDAAAKAVPMFHEEPTKEGEDQDPEA